MGITMMRRAVLGALSLSFLLVLGGGLAAGGMAAGSASPPANPAIVFIEKTSKNVYLRVMNADGSNVRTVVSGGRRDAISDPCWSPDGSRLAFAASLGGAPGLWVVNLGGTGLTRLVPFPWSGMEHVDWSRTATPDGRDKIVFTPYDMASEFHDVCVINPDGSGLQVLDSALQYAGGGICWDHDADALVASDVCDFTLLLLAPAAGGGLVVAGQSWIPLSPCAASPRAANTADRIVYDYLAWPDSGLGVLDLGVSPPAEMQLTFGGEDWPSFSPDDTRLVYRRDGGIYTCTADGTGETLIRSPGGSASLSQPYWRHN